MKFIGLLLVLIPTLAVASEGGQALPFEPVYAANQTTVTSRSMQEELDQFRAISQWQTAKSDYESSKLKFEKAKRDFERAQSLRKTGTITEVSFGQTYYNFRVLQGEMIRLPIEIIKAKVTAQFHMLRVIEEGNPGVDHRLDLANTLIEGLQMEVKSLEGSLGVATTASELAQAYLAQGKALLSKKALAPAELEARELAAQNALIQIRELNEQINLTQTALTGAINSKSKLLAPHS